MERRINPPSSILYPPSSILNSPSTAHPPATVIILSAEDNPEDTIVPRLKAAGADLDRVIIVGGFADDEEPEFPRDLPALRRLIQETGARMVIIDPLIAYLGKDANAHNDQSSRRVLKALDKLAQQTGVAILAIRHLNKQAGQAALYRGGGSIAFIGAARTGLLVAKDPEHPKECLLAVNKVNVGARRHCATPSRRLPAASRSIGSAKARGTPTSCCGRRGAKRLLCGKRAGSWRRCSRTAPCRLRR